MTTKKAGKTTKITDIEFRYMCDGKQVRIAGTLAADGSLNYHIVQFPEKSGIMCSHKGIYVRNSTGEKLTKSKTKSK